jgi:hypothetical protein
MSPNFKRSSGSTSRKNFAGAPIVRTGHLGTEAHRLLPAAGGDDLLEAGEGAAADEQDVGRVDLQELLLRVLAAALRWDARDRAFDDLQERLLHPLARDVAGDRGVLGLAADLVDLVDVDDAALRPLDVVVGVLQELEDDVLDVLAHVARFGERGGIRHGEGHVEDPGERLGQQGLAAPGRADQQDVRLGELDIAALVAVRQSLVVIVHGHREDALGVLLADHVIVEHTLDLGRGRNPGTALGDCALVLLADDIHAQLDAFIADEHGRAGDQFPDLVLALPAEGAIERVLRVAATLGHHPTVPRGPGKDGSGARRGAQPATHGRRAGSTAPASAAPPPARPGDPARRALRTAPRPAGPTRNGARPAGDRATVTPWPAWADACP